MFFNIFKSLVKRSGHLVPKLVGKTDLDIKNIIGSVISDASKTITDIRNLFPLNENKGS